MIYFDAVQSALVAATVLSVRPSFRNISEQCQNGWKHRQLLPLSRLRVRVRHIACVRAGWDNSSLVWYSHHGVLLPKPIAQAYNGNLMQSPLQALEVNDQKAKPPSSWRFTSVLRYKAAYVSEWVSEWVQSWSWVWSIHGLGWVKVFLNFFLWVGLGWVETWLRDIFNVMKCSTVC